MPENHPLSGSLPPRGAGRPGAARNRFCLPIVALLVAACASYNGRGLVPGESTLADVVRVMGKPAMQWENPDRSRQLSYPRGPFGYDSFMVFVDAQGRLQRIQNVLNSETFAKVRPGMSQAEVLRLLGPSEPTWTAYYEARRELDWEWRYCDDWAYAARFDVLLDAESGTVRSSFSREEDCGRGPCDCAR